MDNYPEALLTAIKILSNKGKLPDLIAYFDLKVELYSKITPNNPQT